MLDIDALLSYPVVTRGLIADLPQLREPCTCGAGLPKCPACVAWDERYMVTEEEWETARTTRYTPPGGTTLSEAELAALKRQIVADAAAVRVLEKRQKRQSTLSVTDTVMRDDLLEYLRINRARRDLAYNTSKKGHFYGQRRLG